MIVRDGPLPVGQVDRGERAVLGRRVAQHAGIARLADGGDVVVMKSLRREARARCARRRGTRLRARKSKQRGARVRDHRHAIVLAAASGGRAVTPASRDYFWKRGADLQLHRVATSSECRYAHAEVGALDRARWPSKPTFSLPPIAGLPAPVELGVDRHRLGDAVERQVAGDRRRVVAAGDHRGRDEARGGRRRRRRSRACRRPCPGAAGGRSAPALAVVDLRYGDGHVDLGGRRGSRDRASACRSRRRRCRSSR